MQKLTGKETERTEGENHPLSIEQALVLDKGGDFYQTLITTLEQSIEYYNEQVKAHLTPEEFEQASVLLNSFEAAKNVVSKVANKQVNH